MTSVREATAAELEKLRSNKQFSNLYLYFPPAAVRFVGQVTVAPTTDDNAVELSLSTLYGSSGSVLQDMTCYISGSGSNLYDKGTARIRKVPSGSTFYIGRISEIDWAVGDYVTVVEDFCIWPKHIYVQDETTFFMDWDIAYSDQHNSPDPIVNMGSDIALWLTSGSFVDAALSCEDSDIVVGSIASRVWALPMGGTLTNPTSETPTARFSSYGTFRRQCTATSAAGKTWTGYRYVHVLNPDSPPATGFQIISAQGTIEDGGWSCQVRCDTNVDLSQVRDRARVVLVARDWYDGVEGSIGPLAGHESVVLTGWIAGETIQMNANDPGVTFVIQGPQYWLKAITAFPSGIEDSGFADNSGTADRWTEFDDLVTERSLWHLLHWRSTFDRCCDMYLPPDTKGTATTSGTRGSLWAQIDQIAYKKILARPCCNRYGQLFIEIDLQYVPLDERDAITVVQEVSDNEYELTDIERRIVPEYSYVEVTGVYYSNGEYAARGGVSPGSVPRSLGISENVLGEQVIGSQAEAIELAGLVSGSKAGEIGLFDIDVFENNRLVDIAPHQYVTFSIEEGDSPREITRESFRAIPRGVAFSYTETMLRSRWSLEGEGVQHIGIAKVFPDEGEPPITPPKDPPEPPPPPPENPPPPPESPAGADMVVTTASDVRVSNNLADATPNWVSQFPVGTGHPVGPVDSDLAEWDQKSFFVIVKNEIWKTDDITVAGSCTWTKVWDSTIDFEGTTFGALVRVRCASGTPLKCAYALGWAVNDATGDTQPFVLRTVNNGLTWVLNWIDVALVMRDYTVVTQNYMYERSSDWVADVDITIPRLTDADNTCSPYAMAFTYETIPVSGGGDCLVKLASLSSMATSYNSATRGSNPSASPTGFANNLLGWNDPTAEGFLTDYFGSWSRAINGSTNMPKEEARTTVRLTWGGSGYDYPAKPSKTYATVYIFYSTPSAVIPKAFDVARGLPDVLFVGLQDRIMTSTDGGFNWTQITDSPGATDLRIDPQLGGVVYFWSVDGELKSSVGGVIQPTVLLESDSGAGFWGRIDRELMNGNIWAIHYDGSPSADLKKRSLGSWTIMKSGLIICQSIATYYSNPLKVTILDQTGIYYSEDAGATFVNKVGDWATYITIDTPLVGHLLIPGA